MRKKVISIIIAALVIAIALIVYIILSNYIKIKNTNLNINGKILSNIGDETKIENEDIAKAEVKIEVKHAKVPTLMYHSITDDMAYIEYSINAVSPTDFEKQLKYIKENGYQTLFFDDLEYLGNYTKPIILTFDDGFVDFYNEAFPLLKKYNQKATLFMIVGYINCENYCTLEQLKEMEKSGLVDIQVHTKSHKNLTVISDEKLQEEVVESKELLEEYLDKKVTALCYPYGAYNKTVSKLVSNSYTYAITMDEGCYDIKLNTEQEIPRYTIPRGISINQFVNYISKSIVELKK